jgi:hypothetical protein
MGNFELFKVSGKIRFKSSKSNLLYAESAFIELNWFSYENNNYVGTFKPKKNMQKINLNSVESTQFSLNPASEIKNATISEWTYLPGRHLTSYLNSKH